MFYIRGPIRVFINRDDSGHLEILRDLDSDLELNDAVEIESSFNINGIIEEFVSYKFPPWGFFSKFKIFTEIFFNISCEEFVYKFIEVGP
jgi:hypothetical protein